MKILFMGTPDFSLFSLRALCDAGENIIGVVTQPDKPKGRGYTLTPPPVKVFASERGIPVYQPQTLRGDDFAALLAELAPELIIVAAYGKLLPQNVLDFPCFGCINVHGSLLPEYRGAAPMQRAVIDGKTVTGVTIMQMAAGMDTGDILLKREAPIYENDNFEIVHDRLGKCGAAALLETLTLLREGRLIPQKQDDSRATTAPKLRKEDCRIDFSASARAVHNLIRGLSPFPLAFTHLPDGGLLKITGSELTGVAAQGVPGQVSMLDEGIVVCCGDDTLRLLGVLPEGKGRMSAADFIRGRKLSVGDLLS